MGHGRGRDEVHALGTIVLPSGVLVVGDMGYFNLWSGSDPPDLDHLDVEDENLRPFVEQAVDLRVVGPDAVEAARLFDRQQGTWLYDVPDHGVSQVTHSFDQVVAEHRLNARVEREGRRIPHAERVERAVALGGAEFIVFGVPFVVAGGLPTGVELTVEGDMKDFGSVGRRWRAVTVRVPGRHVEKRHRIGFVGVDWARIALAPPETLDAWQHDLPIDGRADFVFWGAAAREVALEHNAPQLDETHWGWTDGDVYEIADKGSAVEAWVAAHGAQLAMDFRPHSHHWEAMRQVRAHPMEVGQVDLAGGRLLALMTSWGDGIFPVDLGVDASGAVAAVQVELGDAERADRVARLMRG